MIRRLREKTVHVARKTWDAIWIFVEIDGEQKAAAFGYYALFSLFPLFALMLSTGSAFFAPDEVIHTVERFFPLAPDEQKVIWTLVDGLQQSRGSVSLLSIAILLWSSLRFFQGLVRGVNRAWHTVEIPWWQLPLKNLLMTLVLGSALLIGLIAPALLQGARKLIVAFGDFLESHLPSVNFDLVSLIFDLSRYSVAALVLFYALTLLYMLAPRRRVYFHEVWPASLFVTVSLQLCQNAFVNYVPRIVNYNNIYGTVGVIMLLLLWVYFSGVLIIFGACLCAAFSKSRETPAD